MDDRIEVTEENFGDLLIEGLKEAVAYERGTLKGAQVRRVPLTARTVTARKPPVYTADRIRKIRERMNASQRVFAGVLNVGLPTVRAWEQGARKPDGPSRRLLQVAEHQPDVLLGELAGVQPTGQRKGQYPDARQAPA